MPAPEAAQGAGGTSSSARTWAFLLVAVLLLGIVGAAWYRDSAARDVVAVEAPTPTPETEAQPTTEQEPVVAEKEPTPEPAAEPKKKRRKKPKRRAEPAKDPTPTAQPASTEEPSVPWGSKRKSGFGSRSGDNNPFRR